MEYQLPSRVAMPLDQLIRAIRSMPHNRRLKQINDDILDVYDHVAHIEDKIEPAEA